MTIAEKLAVLLKLEPNWDSYGAAKIRPTCTESLARLLESINPPDDAQIVPTCEGGVQAEWYTGDGFDCVELIVYPTDKLGRDSDE